MFGRRKQKATKQGILAAMIESAVQAIVAELRTLRPESIEFTGNTCPLIRRPCIEGKCQWWMHYYGKDPNSDKTIDTWDCTFNWMSRFQLETTKAELETGAAVEELRNRVVDFHTMGPVAGLLSKGEPKATINDRLAKRRMIADDVDKSEEEQSDGST